MISEIKDLIKSTVNPVSGKPESEENRVKDIFESEGDIVIKYDREGLSPSQKRVFEDNILSSVKDKVPADKISFSSISKDSGDVYKSLKSSDDDGPKKETSEPVENATLNVGHGKPAPKKEVPNVKKVIAVASGKGGVGKSTVSVNLALSLKKLNKKVGLLDADIYGPSLPILLGKRDEKHKANDQKKIIPLEAHGLRFMSFGLFIKEGEPVIWRGPMLGGVLNQFLFDVDWGELDYLIIDLPPGTGDVQLSMIQSVSVDGSIIVSTPQDVALLDAIKGFNMFTQVKTPVLGMVENMSSFICSECGASHDIFGNGGVKTEVEKLETNLLGQVPLDIKLRKGSDEGKPYMAFNFDEGDEVSKSYMAIAKNVDKILFESKKDKKGFFGKFFGK